MRTVGVEEELLLVDSESGRPRSVAGRILRQRPAARRRLEAEDGIRGAIEHELQQQQLETVTPPCTSMNELEADLRSWRATAASGAHRAGVQVVAAGTSPLPVEPKLFHEPRYERMAERFGVITSQHLTCGCHVHVAVESADEGVGVIDRIRDWLPVLLAISVNSPFWQGGDTGFASFRTQASGRWPTSGPSDVFGSAAAYRDLVDTMVGSGVLLDEGMIYFDARLSRRYPTVEIRVADVAADVGVTVLIAALCRALVDTAAAAWLTGVPPAKTPSTLIRLASWLASKHGIDDDLLDPLTLRPMPAREVVAQLVEHVRPALGSNGDEELVDSRIAGIFEHGTGARRQRAVFERTGRLADVVADLARLTVGAA